MSMNPNQAIESDDYTAHLDLTEGTTAGLPQDGELNSLFGNPNLEVLKLLGIEVI